MRKSTWLSALLVLAAMSFASAETTVSQSGVTWTFDRDSKVGQYANGDYWVVGPVNVISIEPPSIDETGWIKNGSQLNPEVGEAQGYDSSINSYDEMINLARSNGQPVSRENPLAISSGSLVSTVSKPTKGNRPQLQTAAILTVVPKAPEPGTFRPPPVGDYEPSRWNVRDLDNSILNAFPVVDGAPELAEATSWFEKPWLEQNPNWTGRFIHPADNQPDYGREIAHRLGEGLLSLHLDYTEEDKKPLFIRLVQYGLDVYGTAKLGGKWEDLGGHNPGRKMPMLLAGLALNDPKILEYADAEKHPIFQEDLQTFYITDADVGRILYTADGRPRETYIEEDIGLPEWGEQHTRQPQRDGRNWDAYYRSNVYSSAMGHALAAHLTKGAEQAWNWPAFFDYMDRAFEAAGNEASASAETIQPLVANMWQDHRDTGTDPENPKNP